MLCYLILCYVMFYYIILSYIMLCYIILYYIISYHIKLHNIISYYNIYNTHIISFLIHTHIYIYIYIKIHILHTHTHTHWFNTSISTCQFSRSCVGSDMVAAIATSTAKDVNEAPEKTRPALACLTLFMGFRGACYSGF